MKTLLPIFFATILIGGLGTTVSAESDASPRYVETLEKKDATHLLTVTWSLPGVAERTTETAYFRPPRNKDDVGFNGGKVGSADGKTGGFNCSMRAVPKLDVIDISLSISWTVQPAKGSNSLRFPVQYSENQKGNIAGLAYEISWKELKK